jgi:glutamine synthetase
MPDTDVAAILMPAVTSSSERDRVTSVTSEELLRRVNENHLDLTRFVYCDNANMVRGKTVTAAGLADFVQSGVGLTMAMQGFTPTERIAGDATVGPVGEIRLMPDLETFVELPYAPRQAALLCDMVQLNGEPWELCPRSALKRIVAGAAAEELEIQVGVEHEFYLLRPGTDGVQPFDRSLCFSTAGMNEAGPIILEILDALRSQGVQPVQYYPELGPGQQEISIQHAPALQAADQTIIARETVRGVAQSRGLAATFAPKPFVDQAGSGSHIHLSVWRSGRNAFHDASDRLGLSPLAYTFIGGLLEHLPALLALTCPSLNSYQRLAPGMWSSAFVCYGADNREAAIRIASPFSGREEASTNIELKAIDGSANPYLALAGVIAAGLDGVRRGLRPGAEIQANPAALSDAERQRLGIRRFPASVQESAEALEADLPLRSAVGTALISEMLAVRRSETEDLLGLDAGQLAARYAGFY